MVYFMKNNKKNFVQILKQKQRIKDKTNYVKADEILAKNYTYDDIIDIKARWKMLDLDEKSKDIINQAAEIAAKSLNFLSCVEVHYKNLNKLNTFENATKKGLTKEMTDEQKETLKKISKDVSLARILFVSGKYLSKIAMIIACTNVMLCIYWQDLYQQYKNPENIIVYSMLIYCLYCLIHGRILTKKIDKDIVKMVYSNMR